LLFDCGDDALDEHRRSETKMSDAILITVLGFALLVMTVIRGVQRRRLRDAVAPVGAAAGVLNNVYLGRGTDGQLAADFDPTTSTSMTLDGDDPLRSHGVDVGDKVQRD
jgi:hypothetical protein